MTGLGHAAMWAPDRRWDKYVGKPFSDHGVGPTDFHCWGLVRHVLKIECGIDVPEYGDISARDLIAMAHQVSAAERADPWRAVDTPRAFDVALMRGTRGGGAVIHVGIMVDGRNVLHIQRATDSVIVPVNHYSVHGRIMGYRRHKDIVPEGPPA